MKDVQNQKSATHGRGVGNNPKNRFERLAIEAEEGADCEQPKKRRTEYFADHTRSIIATNTSPDLSFGASINPYRGCEHGCVYCYARPTHEYIGLSAGLDFESKIFIKKDAPELLRKALSAKSWQPQPIFISGITDAYQPIERKLQLTRRCLEVLADFRNPVGIVTKNALVTRDKDLLAELARHQAAQVSLSITTLDAQLARTMEPRTSRPDLRLKAIRELCDAGIPTGVIIGPVIPGLNDHEILPILEEAAAAGATSAHYVVLRLPYGVKEIFSEWLEQHYPLRAKKVLHRIQDVRGGKLYNAEFGSRMKGTGLYAETIAQHFALGLKKYGLNRSLSPLSSAAFRRVQNEKQMSLF